MKCAMLLQKKVHAGRLIRSLLQNTSEIAKRIYIFISAILGEDFRK
jgi:hypothetical protein